VEARGRGPKGESLEGVKARRGSADGHRVTAARRVRISRMLESLELRLDVFVSSRRTARRTGASRGVAATGRGNPLKAETQGRYRHETRLEGCGRNEASRG
jgi:hypothetical protein